MLLKMRLKMQARRLRLLGNLLAGNALQSTVVLGPARESGLDEVRARPAHLRLDALGHALERARRVLGAHRGLVHLALRPHKPSTRNSTHTCQPCPGPAVTVARYPDLCGTRQLHNRACHTRHVTRAPHVHPPPHSPNVRLHGYLALSKKPPRPPTPNTRRHMPLRAATLRAVEPAHTLSCTSAA